MHNILNSRKQSPWTEDPAEVKQLEFHSSQTETDLERVVSSREMLRALGERLSEGLSERDLSLFNLLYVQQKSDEVVRQEIGISRDALYQARRRLLKRALVLASDIVAEYSGQIVGAL